MSLNHRRGIRRTVQRAAAVAPPPTCTKSWTTAIGGIWSDPSRWTPAGVPSIADDVCIAASGTYDITGFEQIDVRSLRIGSTGANVNFTFDPTVRHRYHCRPWSLDRTGQLVTSAPLLFDAATWKLPRTIDIEALDDSIVEPTHHDTVRYVLRSADPVYTGSTAHRTLVTITDNDGNTDLALTLQNAPSIVASGAVFEVVYRITNNGPTLSTGATLTIDPLGATNFSFQQAFGAACSANGAGIVTCSVAGQAAAAQNVVSLVYQAAAAGSITFDGIVVSEQPDPNAANSQVIANVVVN